MEADDYHREERSVKNDSLLDGPSVEASAPVAGV